MHVQSELGYWSQNSFIQVLGANPEREVTGIEVIWFDGTKQTITVSEGKRKYRIAYPKEE